MNYVTCYEPVGPTTKTHRYEKYNKDLNESNLCNVSQNTTCLYRVILGPCSFTKVHVGVMKWNRFGPKYDISPKIVL